MTKSKLTILQNITINILASKYSLWLTLYLGYFGIWMYSSACVAVVSLKCDHELLYILFLLTERLHILQPQ